MNNRIVFLHIPKTAGQSVHAFLTNIFGIEYVFPARVNEQLFSYSRLDLQKYIVFSGHFDWCRLDSVMGNKFTFSILRDPIERIVSFYLYLRREAEKLSSDEIHSPLRQGMKAALFLSPDEYFVHNQPLRNFIDDHYNNFYSFYFAGRSYDARQKIIAALSYCESNFDKEEQIVRLALENISCLDNVYSIYNWYENLKQDLLTFTDEEFFRNKILESQNYKANVGDQYSLSERLQSLVSLGATSDTFKKIKEYTRLDYSFLDNYKSGTLLNSRNSISTLNSFICDTPSELESKLMSI